MLGAIIGDIIGSRFEHRPCIDPDFSLFHPDCRFTDDSVLTAAVADALLHRKRFPHTLREYARRYPNAGYGHRFMVWALADDAPAYGSWGNGSAMRVAPVAYASDQLETVLHLAKSSAEATHNHPEGIAGAEATATAVFLARVGQTKEHIREIIEQRFGYDLQRSLSSIRANYRFEVSCSKSVPEAIIAFLEADCFETAVRNAVMLGGDADTQACIAGAIAEAWFGGVPEDIRKQGLTFLDDHLRSLLQQFQTFFPGHPVAPCL